MNNYVEDLFTNHINTGTETADNTEIIQDVKILQGGGTMPTGGFPPIVSIVCPVIKKIETDEKKKREMGKKTNIVSIKDILEKRRTTQSS